MICDFAESFLGVKPKLQSYTYTVSRCYLLWMTNITWYLTMNIVVSVIHRFKYPKPQDYRKRCGVSSDVEGISKRVSVRIVAQVGHLPLQLRFCLSTWFFVSTWSVHFAIPALGCKEYAVLVIRPSSNNPRRRHVLELPATLRAPGWCHRKGG